MTNKQFQEVMAQNRCMNCQAFIDYRLRFCSQGCEDEYYDDASVWLEESWEQKGDGDEITED